MENMVAGLHQFLETEKYADRTRHNHHHGTHEITFVPHGNCKDRSHEHGDYTDGSSDAQNQFVEFFFIQSFSSALELQI